MTVHRSTLLDTKANVCAEDFRLDSRQLANTPANWSVSQRRLRGGLSDGVDVIDVDTGRIRFCVVPTRGMGLWRGRLDDHVLGWDSPVRGPVHPHYVRLAEPSGLGFLDGPDELMFRCGLESSGAPDFHDDGRLRFPLHGKIANLPAHHVEVTVDDVAGSIAVRGQVEECRFLFQKLRLTVEYTADFDGDSITWQDRVENFGGVEARMQMMYHTNIGAPLLAPGWQLVAPVARLCPRDQVAMQAGVEHWQTYPAPRADSWEQVYFLQLRGDSSGHTQVMLRNPRANLGVGLSFNLQILPWFTQWRNTQAPSDGYVTGIEPGTNFPNPRSFEERHGRIVALAPGAVWQSGVTLAIYSTADRVAKAASAIAELQGDRQPEKHTQPLADWSPHA